MLLLHRRCLYALLLLLFQLPAIAGNLNHTPFEYYGEAQSLRSVLTAIATHSRLGVKVHEDIVEEFNGHLKRRNSRDALTYLASTYDLVWYSDGATLYVDPINAMQSQLFNLDFVDASEIKRTMKALKLWDARFEWRALKGSSILMASGPPRYLELIQETINLLGSESRSDGNDALQMRVFKLTHAAAADRRVTVRDQQTILPGIATLLNQLLGSAQGNGTITDMFSSVETDYSTTETVTTDKNVTDNVPNGKERSKNRNIDNSASLGAGKVNLANQSSMLSKGAPHPLAAIFPDQGTNSVIIQDYASRLRLYAQLIDQLDQARDQLEINLLIIDLSTNSLNEIGVDWSLKNKTIASGRGLIDLILPGANSASTELLTQSNADFLAKVTALESQGKARVTSRPAVVTESGVEAVLDNNETFFVRIQGERVAELEAITYGTLLQVTPRIIEGLKPKSIYLDVKIEDANRLLDGGVESLPTIRNTQISTRTSIPNGSSLLIGGYYREASSKNRDGVPVLSDLPLLGRLFQHDGENNSQVVRLFMLSPRILSKEVFRAPEPEEMNDDFSIEQQIRSASSLSNYNSVIARMQQSHVCDSASAARKQRNYFQSKGYHTQIVDCRKLDGSSGYRVMSENCSNSLHQRECQ